MVETITRAQLDELRDESLVDQEKFHELLEKYTGIIAKPYTGYSFYDGAGNYLGSNADSDVMDLLRAAYIRVEDRDDKVNFCAFREYHGEHGFWWCVWKNARCERLAVCPTPPRQTEWR